MIVYIIEDNKNIREAASSYLRLEGYTVEEFDKLRQVGKILEQSKESLPSLLILDVMLPDGDGFLFAKQLKQLDIYKKASNIPIIFLTARDQESDRITGLELGADDYIVKPFSTKELVLRVNAVLRRSMNQNQTKAEEHNIFYQLNEHKLLISVLQHKALLNGNSVLLTAAEWNILLFLSRKPTQVFSRQQLLENCLDSIAEGSERTIDTHIKNMRQKLNNIQWIETVRGFGYRFNGAKID